MSGFEFISGIIITIIGVITVEWIVFKLKQRYEVHSILKSLEYEIAENIDIAGTNYDRYKQGKVQDYLLFRVDAYYRFKQSMSANLMNKMKKGATESLFVGYNECEDFNRKYVVDPFGIQVKAQDYFNIIRNTFKKFLDLQNTKN